MPNPRSGQLAILILIATTLAASILGSSFTHASPAGKPIPTEKPPHTDTNLILISLQCLRPDHLGVYGYHRETSPNIDALARDSVLFENAISQANLTPVAQMSVLTSQYPRINGMVSFEVTKDSVSKRTLPEILKLYGYETAATVSSPEFFLRYDSGSGSMVSPGDLFSRSFNTFARTRKGPGGQSVRKVPVEAYKWLKVNRDKKFFLWIASGLLHMPYGAAVPKTFRTLYDPPGHIPFWKRLPLGGWEKTASEHPDYDVFSRVLDNKFYWDFQPAYELTQEDTDYVNSRYDAGVYYTDLFIGELMRLLDSLDLSRKTMIVLQSIHGEDLGERGDFFHYDVTDTVVKNALIFRFPNRQFAGRRVKEQVQGIDIMPTILDYLQIPAPHEAQGESILPLLKGEAETLNSRYAFIDRLPWWEFTLEKWYLEFKAGQGSPFSPSEQEKLKEYRDLLQSSFAGLDYPPGDIAIRTNDWKLIIRKQPELLSKVSWWDFISARNHEVAPMELYDLNQDPLEKTNVVSKHPDIAAALKAKLLAWDRATEEGKAAYRQNGEKMIIPYP